jgi:integrase
MTWEQFRSLYEVNHLESLAEKTARTAATALNRFETFFRPTILAHVDAQAISAFATNCREDHLSESAIAAYLRHLRAALNWAKKQGYLAHTPNVVMPKRTKAGSLMRSRPITEAEYVAMLDAVPTVRKHDAERWQWLLKGLWCSGLRLGEALQLSWDTTSPVAIVHDGDLMVVSFLAEGHKAHTDVEIPVVPEFARLLEEVPIEKRRGLVFPLFGESDRVIRHHVACREIAKIGKAANIVVEARSGKHATAHDLRRAFATRWLQRETPGVVQLLMRHRSIQTTLAYYAKLDAKRLGREILNRSANY